MSLASLGDLGMGWTVGTELCEGRLERRGRGVKRVVSKAPFTQAPLIWIMI